jgi:hypothetical protein
MAGFEYDDNILLDTIRVDSGNQQHEVQEESEEQDQDQRQDRALYQTYYQSQREEGGQDTERRYPSRKRKLTVKAAALIVD